MTSIKLPYGLKNGNLVSIDEVERGLVCACTCPECNSSLIANKGKVKAHYFSHKGDQDCNGESLLHTLGKKLLSRRINHAIQNKIAVPITWPCNTCNAVHEGNLVKMAERVELEVPIGNCRPDIVVYGKNDRILAFIEIVVTHYPESYVYDYCNDNNISLLIFRVCNIQDVMNLAEKEKLDPGKNMVCIAPRCPECKSIAKTKNYYIFETNCWYCDHRMPVIFVTVDGTISEPKQFTEYDQTIARANGILLKKASPWNLWFNACTECQRCLGENLFRKYWGELHQDNLHSEVLWCEKCCKEFPGR